jgi:nitrogen fixation NifU-like protein
VFSSIVMDHFQNPRNVGDLEPCSGVGLAGSREVGRFLQLSVQIDGGIVQAARFRTYGCVPAIASGSCLVEWVEGLTVDEARAITPVQLLERLGGLPPKRTFCTVLAVEALRNALDAARKETTPCK